MDNESTPQFIYSQPTRSEARDSANALILAQDFAYDPAHRPSQTIDTRPGMPTPHSRTYNCSAAWGFNSRGIK